ncbi:MAG: GNAT family N-acetyltransferase [Halolamina sp.]|uniref:GNAT family N-acetyltransferase n=1 Tax=Halolamina sp. TaxID=1940283 RepID=UPI002FC2E46F
MQIRPLRESEVPTLVDELWTPFSRGMAEHDPYHELVDEFREDTIEYRRERLGEEGRIDRVSVVTDKLVGYVTAEFQETPPVFAHEDTVHINELYVRPEFRREGIGVDLLAHAESWGEDQGCGYATLNVDRWNESAQTLYRAEGFEVKRYNMRKPLD